MEEWVPFILFVLSWNADGETISERQLMADEAACEEARSAIDGAVKDGRMKRAFCMPFFTEEEVEQAWTQKREAD